MRTPVLLLTLVLGASPCLLNAQQDPSPRGPRAGREGRPGDQPSQGGFRLLPPPVAERMNLTEEQQKKIAALEGEMKAQLEKILTPDQREQLSRLGPPPREGGAPTGDRPERGDRGDRPERGDRGERGGPGGPGGGGPGGGGPGGQGPGGAPGGGGPGGPGFGGQGGQGGQRAVNPLIDALDTNKDGSIDAQEMKQATASLKKLDKNNDGQLTSDEYRPQRGGGQGGPGGFGGPGGEGRPGSEGRRGGQGGPGGPGGQGGQGGQGRPQRPPLEN